MDNNEIRNIIIVGGGTAGWSAAACLSVFLKKRNVKITLIESSAIGTVGVGEASLPNLQLFNKYVGLEEDQFMKSTNGTFKLGIRFDNWADVDKSFFHAFGAHGMPLSNVEFHQCFNSLRSRGQRLDLADYSLSANLALAGKFALPPSGQSNPLATFGYAYHFDAIKYAGKLKEIAIANGVITIDDRVQGVNLDAQTGFIQSLDLEKSPAQSADLFIDCSGFRSLLLGDALDVEYVSWKKWLPCDRAVAMGGAVPRDNLPSYTVSKALDSGWSWKIPLKNRTGNGYVYSSAHIDDDDALDTLLADIEAQSDAQPNFQRFEAGMRSKFFHKNCVALGLAGGFMEPLESTSISLVFRGLQTLMDHFPDKNCDERLANAASKLFATEQENIRDFIILHYHGSRRNDSPFWKDVGMMDVPQSLTDKIESYQAAGIVRQYEIESFKPGSWVTMYDGFGITPLRNNLVADSIPEASLINHMRQIRQIIASVTARAPDHRSFLAQVY